jgi:acetylornithine deacetylase/succinyl-diaminopimelate desuccinylase-like protein
MGEIKIDIPKDMEAAFEEAFPDEDKAAAVLHLIEAEIARRQDAEAAAEGSLEGLVEEVLRLRQEPPYFSDEDIRKAREELRK